MADTDNNIGYFTGVKMSFKVLTHGFFVKAGQREECRPAL
jgi:hypothetical protein